MRVLVTGAAGFIGSHLSETLLTAGHEVVGFDNFDPFYPRAVKERNLESAREHPAFAFVEGDLRDADAVAALFDEPYDVVVHLAAKAGVRPSLLDPGAYLETNLIGTQHVLNAMIESGCDRLVFASSSSVYGNNEKVPFHEEDRVDRPISVYAMTKKANEEQVHVYAELHGIRTVCLRLFTVYGPRQRPEMAIHKFTRRIHEGRPIPVYGDGSMERDFTYIDDLVSGVVAAVERVERMEFEIVNLGNSTPVSLNELLAALEAATGRGLEIDRRPVPAGDVRRTFASVEKAKAMLGYEPKTPLEEGLAKFIAWYREVPAALATER